MYIYIGYIGISIYVYVYMYMYIYIYIYIYIYVHMYIHNCLQVASGLSSASVIVTVHVALYNIY